MDSERQTERPIVLATVLLAGVLGCILGCVLGGCASNRVLVNLDMASFMSVEERTFPYLLPGVDPGQSFADSTEASRIELPEGMNDIVDLEEMSLDLALALDNRQVIGAVQMNYRIVIHIAASADPADLWRPESRLLELSGPVTGGTVTTTGVERLDVSGFLDLLRDHETVYVASAFEITHVSGIGLVDGRAEITALDLHIASRADLF